MPLLLLGWSIAVCTLTRVQNVGATLFMLFGILTGLRFQFMRAPKEDRRSYLWYDLWLSAAQILPFL